MSDWMSQEVQVISLTMITGNGELLTVSENKEPELFKDVFVPGTGPFYEKNGLLYLSEDEIRIRAAIGTTMERRCFSSAMRWGRRWCGC